jgi:hypothetical protein
LPLIKSASKKALGRNISAEIHAGRSKEQAIAIAESVKRKAAHQSNKDILHSMAKKELAKRGGR